MGFFSLKFYHYPDYVYSENTMYHPRVGRTASGKMYTTLYKDPEICRYQENIKQDIINQVDLDCLPQFDLVYSIVALYVFGIPQSSFLERDVTNCVKAVEDAVFEVMHFDDAHVHTNIAHKEISERYFIYGNLIFITDPEIEMTGIFERLFADYRFFAKNIA